MLKALKSPSGGLKVVDRTVFFGFFDINSIHRDSKDLKFIESWMYMLMPTPRLLL